jgi:rRNA biogenesis protein RRP5
MDFVHCAIDFTTCAPTRDQQSKMSEPTPEQVMEEFEKRLIGTPNSSLLWIKYISTTLKLTTLPAARTLTERALATISFREEQEKLNIWVAYLNMENLYGTADTVKKVFERSLVYCDPRTMWMQLAKIYSASEKHAETVETYQMMTKKFGQSCKVWLAYAEYLYEKDVGSARKLLVAAIKSLPKRKHEKATMKFAQLEYKSASVERGRTLFEGILANSPKRIDIWSIYLTMEENLCKKGQPTANKEMLRRLFERVVHMKLSSKKAKFFFKKFLEFEKGFGSEATVSHVKDLARQYVENTMNK